jgi:hypothetical protein
VLQNWQVVVGLESIFNVLRYGFPKRAPRVAFGVLTEFLPPDRPSRLVPDFSLRLIRGAATGPAALLCSRSAPHFTPVEITHGWTFTCVAPKLERMRDCVSDIMQQAYNRLI